MPCSGLKGPAPKRYFAIQEWVEADERLPYFSSIFDPEITDYYCWTIPKGDHLVIGAALAAQGQDRREIRAAQDAGCGTGASSSERPSGGKARSSCDPSRSDRSSTGAQGVALLGEAAGWISPSSAEGLSYAFRSAQILAEVLHTGLEDFERRYHRATLPMRRNILLKSLKSRVVFNPALRGMVMRLGLQSMTVCGVTG